MPNFLLRTGNRNNFAVRGLFCRKKVKMPVFEYKGTTSQGHQTRGSVQAENIQQAKAQLKKDNIFIFELKNKTAKEKKHINLFAGKRVDIKTLCTMTRLLSTLIKSNVPLVDSLTTITKQIAHPTLTPALIQIRNQVNEGEPLYKALSQYPKIFNTTYISMCEAGESSGTLDIILLKLAEFTENQAELNNKIRSALAYPILMTFFTFGIVMFLFTYVVPKITTLLEDEQLIPWYTALLMSFSQFIINSWIHLLIGFSLIFFLAYRWTKKPKGRKKIDALCLKLPLIGKIIRFTSISRFTRTLSTLLKGGVPMLKAMDIVQNVAKNIVLKQAIKKAQSNIREGESIAHPLEESGEFPPMTIQMIKIGEKTGELEDMLVKISDTYDFQINTEVNTLASLLAPVMIMLMGGIVAFILFAVMMPIMQMYNQT